jgi:uncharacterized membrane protein YqhA
MNQATRLKGLGYIISILSVLLLAAVAWSSASDEPLLLACLMLGVLSSIIGMSLRWRAHIVDQRSRN